MKYQSEIIHEILEQRGHDKSSLHYQSECIESWIEETKGAYPKLTDYQAEWLNYMIENPIGEFPYIALTDVTEATVNNVVPYAYKSAILKGKTDENLQSVKMPVLTTTGKNLFNPKWLKNTETESVLKFEDDGSITLNGTLKTLTWFYLDLPKGSYQASSFNDTLKAVHVFWTGTDGTFETRSYFTLNEDTHIKGYITKGNYDNYNVKFQLETGTQKTSYEPYKSNIVTVNEDVTLRGIGDVRDTLDLITGEIIESIGEGVLNGSEEWIFNEPKEQPNHWCFHNHQKLSEDKLLISDKFPQSDIDGDKESIRGGGDFIFVYISKEKVEGNVNSFKQWLTQNPIKYQYRKSEKSVKTVDLIIQDQDGNTLSKIKPIEGTMHIQTDGTPIKPTVSMEIPVEATTQNLASFIEGE